MGNGFLSLVDNDMIYSVQLLLVGEANMVSRKPTAARAMRIADRLSAARRGRFVGRLTELELFRSALLSADPSFAVLYVYGPGGVGKTTLLHEYARVASICGRPVVHLDGRNVDPSPTGFLLAVRQSLGLEAADVTLITAQWPSNGVLLLDTYELMTPLDSWLRETFLPELPSQSSVVIAGRNAPEAPWRTEIEWAELTRIVPLHNLSSEESQTYLAARGIPADQYGNVLAFTQGHPLALALVADVLSQDHEAAPFQPENEPDVLRILLERLVQNIPSVEHRLALEVCVRVWATTEAVLLGVLDVENVRELFEWLRSLSFIEQGPQGLFPHDLVREALDADMRWRNPDGFRQLNQRLSAWLRTRLEQARGAEQWRAWFDVLYLERHNPFIRPYFAWSAMGNAYVEPASPHDYAPILSMVRQHQGEVSAQIAGYWLQRQPQAFSAFRSAVGELFGFMASLDLHQATAEDIAADPAVLAALDYVKCHGPARQGEEIIYVRFWMDQEAYQQTSAALNLLAVSSTIYWTTHPKLAWNFMVTANPTYYEPHFTSFHLWRTPEADFEIDGYRYGVFAHDWRVEPASVWLNLKAELASVTDLAAELPVKSPNSTLLFLSEAEFAQAVRDALRDYTRPDQLATNPLMSSRLLIAANGQVSSPITLQALLLEAVMKLEANPKDKKLYRAIWHTYLEPAETQELAAELLQIPFSTYRYHLAKGIERIGDWLWQRELNGATN